MKPDRSQGHSARSGVVILLFVAAVAAQLHFGTDQRVPALVAFLVAIGAWLFVIRETVQGRMGTRWIVAGFVVGILTAVAFAPATSKDFNSYALYGRMISTYNLSPYTHEPVDIAFDAWFSRTSAFWSDSPSVYGPAFSGLSALITSVTETSVTATRLAFQSVAALGLVACVALASRRLGRTKAIAFIGLNPLLLTFGVNDAHCDLLVGAGILAATLALGRQRFLLAGAMVGLAASVKIACLPALGGAVVWALFRKPGGVRNAAAVLIGGVGVAGAFLLAAGGADALSPLQDAAGRHTRFSVWNPLHQFITDRSAAGLPGTTTADHVISLLANIAVVSVGLVLIVRYRKHAEPVAAVAVGLVVYQLLGAYVLAWYAAWSLPALALIAGSRLFWIAFAHAAWVALAYFSGIGVLVTAAVVLIWIVWKRPDLGSLFGSAASDPHSGPNRGSLSRS